MRWAAANTEPADGFIAAVFESSPNQTSAASPAEGLKQMLTTLASYKPYFSEAAASGAEILVLNEMSISGFSFVVSEQVTPYLIELPAVGNVACGSVATSPDQATPTNTILPALSCIARDLNLTLVVDLAEKRPCEHIQAPCPKRGYFQFNSQIVLLGGTGALTSVYVKNHLFLPGNEGDIFDSAPWQPSYATFQSHTGRIFGQAVCFDLFYPNPILALAGMGIRDIVFSSYWENLKSYPLITASSLQRAVSEAANVNLIGGSVGYSWQNSGSGLYSQGKIVNATFNEGSSPTNRLLTAFLPSLAPTRPLLANEARLQQSSMVPGLLTWQHAPQVKLVEPVRSNMSLRKSYVGNMTLTRIQLHASESLRIARTVNHEGIQCVFNVTIQAGAVDTTVALIAQDGQYMVGAMRTQLCAIQECPRGLCSLDDIPLPLSAGVTLQSGSVTMDGFTATKGLVAAVGAHGRPVDSFWAPWQQHSAFGIMQHPNAPQPLQITGICLLGTYPYFHPHQHMP